MVMGTSTCHLMLNKKRYDVNGISGVVKDAIIPGLYAYEAGQTAVGDLFGTFNKQLPSAFETEVEKRGITTFQLLEEKAKERSEERRVGKENKQRGQKNSSKKN